MCDVNEIHAGDQVVTGRGTVVIVEYVCGPWVVFRTATDITPHEVAVEQFCQDAVEVLH